MKLQSFSHVGSDKHSEELITRLKFKFSNPYFQPHGLNLFRPISKLGYLTSAEIVI